MRRSVIVLGGTVAGLAGVLAFHTTPARTGLPAAAAGAAPAPTGTTAPPARPPHRPGRSASRASEARTATGQAVNYYYGILSVRVKVSGSRIVRVGIASLNDGGNPRSQFIDQQSIPLLEQQAMQAQSASIQGVSGASYTSAGFAKSLQSALHSLGLR